MAARKSDNAERSGEASVEEPGAPEEDGRAIDRSMTRRKALSLVALS